MKLKGHSTIQLFDAKTGREVRRQSDNNMVTNALSQIFNPPEWLQMWGGGIYAQGHTVSRSFSNIIRAWTPLGERMLGGVFAFKNRLPEDANVVMMPYDNTMTACAGPQTSSYSNSRIGTHNDAESGSIEKGWRHVWDFPTDKGNGEIACLSLTSINGGFYGIQGTRGTQYISGGVLPSINPVVNSVDYQGFNAGNTVFAKQTNWETGITGAIIDDLNSGRQYNSALYGVFYAEELSNGDIKILFAPSFNSVYATNMRGYWGIKEYIISDPRKANLVSITTSVKSMRNVIAFPDDSTGRCICPYVYNNQIHIVYPNSATSFTHTVYSLSDYTQISTKQINTSDTLATNHQGGMLYWQGEYIGTTATDYHLIRIAEDGQTIEDTGTVCYIRGVYVDENSGAAYVSSAMTDFLYYNNGTSSSSSSTYRLALVKLTKTSGGEFDTSWASFIMGVGSTWGTGYSLPHSSFLVKVKGMSLPRYINGEVYCDCGGNTSSYPQYGATIRWVYGIDYTYLATINNLSAPVTKTQNQTMKITYDITEE